MTKCTLCNDVGWVCEEHPGRPWAGPKTCGCGAAGMPAHSATFREDGEAPRMPDGFEIEDDKDGWLH